MDLRPSDEQQQLIDTFSAFYANQCPVERVRAAEPSGHDTELWTKLQEMGAVQMALDEPSGGWGASLLDLGLVAELHGRHLAPAPLIEAQAAARLLARAGGAVAAQLLEGILAGHRFTTLALHEPCNGTLALVPAGAVADDVVFFDGTHLLSMETAGHASAVSTIGSLPVADIAIDRSAVVVQSGPQARQVFELARDEWMVLMANALGGLGTRALEIGVDYVKERQAFGVPIGSFQAVAHGLADAATAVEGSVLLAREAAWAAQAEPARAPLLASLSCGFSVEAAREASYRGLHYHGGYGFMLEFDVQLFFQRAISWPAVFGEPALMFARAAAFRLSSSNVVA